MPRNDKDLQSRKEAFLRKQNESYQKAHGPAAKPVRPRKNTTRSRPAGDADERAIVTESMLLLFERASYLSGLVLLLWAATLVVLGGAEMVPSGAVPPIRSLPWPDLGGMMDRVLAGNEDDKPFLLVCEARSVREGRERGDPLTLRYYRLKLSQIEDLRRELADPDSDRRQRYAGQDLDFITEIPSMKMVTRGDPPEQTYGYYELPLRRMPRGTARCQWPGDIERTEFQP